MAGLFARDFDDQIAGISRLAMGSLEQQKWNLRVRKAREVRGPLGPGYGVPGARELGSPEPLVLALGRRPGRLPWGSSGRGARVSLKAGGGPLGSPGHPKHAPQATTTL